jgi:hypothetical protein
MDDVIFARVALAGLRTIAQAREQLIRSYALLPDLTPLTESQIVSKLAAVAKPTQCMGFVENHVLMVGCWPQDLDPKEVEVHRWMWAEYRRVKERQSGSIRILVRQTEPRIVLTDQQFEEWNMEYDLPLVVVSWRDATSELRRDGVEFVLEFDPPDPEMKSSGYTID